MSQHGGLIASQRLQAGALVWAIAVTVAAEIVVGVGAVAVRVTRSASASAALTSLSGPGKVPGLPVRAGPSPAAPVPIEVMVPTIGVRAALVRLGLDRDGRLEVPGEFGAAGWWAEGAAPGEDGPAIVVGHRDSETGPAVFYRVPTLEPGDEVSVLRSDGTSVAFVVEERLNASKDDFPTERVYGPTAEPTLRLITCGGRFDRRAGSYEENVIVFARLRSEPPGGRS